jgi:hypothetical protein
LHPQQNCGSSIWQKIWIISARKGVQHRLNYPILNLLEQRAQKPLYFKEKEGVSHEEPHREQHPDRRRIAKGLGGEPTLGRNQA